MNVLREKENHRRQLARKISWDAKSTPREIAIYKEIQRMIVASYDPDDIFRHAANELPPADKQIVAHVLRQIR